MRARSFGWLVAWALILGKVSHSFAQQATPTSQGQAEVTPAGEYQEGIAVGGWMLFPSVFAGTEYDDNFNQSSSGTQRDSGTNLRLAPNLTATYDGGISQTTLYGVADAQFFSANTIAATTGISHNYQPTQDIAFNFFGNYTRETDVFDSALNFNNGAIGPSSGSGPPPGSIPIFINPFGTTPSANSIAYNQFTGSASVTRTINQGFLTLSGTAFDIVFDHPDNAQPPFQTSHDGASFWITGKAGYHVTPQLYGFVETDGIFQRFANSIFDTNGYRVTGGLGSDDRNSLFQGDIYAGYQAQSETDEDVANFGVPTNANSPVVGGHLYYYPTEYFTIVGQIDQLLGLATQLSPTIPNGTPSLATTAIVQATYKLHRSWSVGGRFGYTRAEFIGSPRLDTGWLAGASFNYEIWRNVQLTLDYQHETVNSNVAFAGFMSNRYTAGLTYRY